MKMLKIAAAALVAASSSVPAFAVSGFMTGNELYALCTATSGVTVWQDKARCSGYIVGVTDLMELDRHWLGAKKDCLRPDVQAGQLTDVAVQALRNHPESRDSLAADLVLVAITTAFCPVVKS